MRRPPAQTAQAQALCEKRKAKRPEAYTKGELHYEELVKRDDLDLVYIPTPWRWHVRMAVAAMQAGKHAIVEVPAAVTLEECWKLVEVSERTRRHCVMIENCNYGYEEMLVNRMVKAGLFGELLHAECAYNHDLRKIVFENRSEGLWRRAEHIGRNGNLYPTHGLGPVAWYLGIHKGDRFDHMVSMSSPEAGLTAHRKATVPAGDPKWQEKYDCGDVNTSLLKTARGRTIMLQHNIANPRPYDRINLVAGTKGIFRGYPARIFFDGHPGEHKWASLKEWKKRYEDPLWTQLGKAASKSGHGGMDYVMSWRLVDCVRRGLRPRHGRLRRRGLERAGAPQRDVGGRGERARAVPRLHPRALEGLTRGRSAEAVEGPTPSSRSRGSGHGWPSLRAGRAGTQ